MTDWVSEEWDRKVGMEGGRRKKRLFALHRGGGAAADTEPTDLNSKGLRAELKEELPFVLNKKAIAL